MKTLLITLLFLISSIKTQTEIYPGPFSFHWRHIIEGRRLTPPFLGFEPMYKSSYYFTTIRETPSNVLKPYNLCIRSELVIQSYYDNRNGMLMTGYHSNMILTFLGKPQRCLVEYVTTLGELAIGNTQDARFYVNITNSFPKQNSTSFQGINEMFLDLKSYLYDQDNDTLSISDVKLSTASCGTLKQLNGTSQVTFIPDTKTSLCNLTFNYTDSIDNVEGFITFINYPKEIVKSVHWRNPKLDLSTFSREKAFLITNILTTTPLNCTSTSIQDSTVLNFKDFKIGNCSIQYSVKTDKISEMLLTEAFITFYNSAPETSVNPRIRIHRRQYLNGVKINFSSFTTDQDQDPLRISKFAYPSTIALLSQNSALEFELKLVDSSFPIPTLKIEYTVTDEVDSRNGTLFIDVFNNLPVAVDDVFNVTSGIPFIFDVLSNDKDLDVPLYENLTIVSVTNSRNGTAVIDSKSQKIIFQTNTTKAGSEIIKYVITDGLSQSEAEIKINYQILKINGSSQEVLKLFVFLFIIFIYVQ